MSADAMAIKAAVALLSAPLQVRFMRRDAILEGTPMLLRIAGQDPDALRQAISLSDRPPAVVQSAAAFYIEQILLAPDSDSYRVLGAPREASAADLRRNMALLLRWLHPDIESNAERSVFAARVTKAWGDLKTPELRAAYDKALQGAQKPASKKRRMHGLSKMSGRTGDAGSATSLVHAEQAGRARPSRSFWRSALSLIFWPRNR